MTDDLPLVNQPLFPITDPARVEVRVLRSTDILGGRNEVLIEHGGQLYRLRSTRSGKLILQK